MEKLVKPAIILVIVIAAAFVLLKWSQSRDEHRSAMADADRFALESAINLRSLLESGAPCPEAPIGWEDSEVDDHNDVVVLRGNEHGQFRVAYSCNLDKTFNIAVLYSFDSATYYTGRPGENIKVTHGHFTSPEHFYVANESEIDHALTIIYGGE